MADNYLERHREEYEQRKANWLKRKRHFPHSKPSPPQKPDDEAL
jgi:hypothetical protein